MAEKDKPLHVKVAEALGWTNLCEVPVPPFVTEPHWLGDPPSWLKSTAISAIDHETGTVTLTRGTQTIPRYDTDWSATGPLIERIRIGLIFDAEYARRWCAFQTDGFQFYVSPTALDVSIESDGGATPLIAVCNLILALHAAGKLDAAAS